ncbi:MAG TPA: 50S ribosomal protein L31 [Solirubrobacteraceae bacterium]|jgi:large subunit ribosomal protein L31
MKDSIHPSYVQAHVRCTCGNEFTTRATQDEIHVEVCSNCHPFYTGRQKLVDTGGRVERFQRRVAKGRLRSSQSGGGQTGASQTQAQPQ